MQPLSLSIVIYGHLHARNTVFSPRRALSNVKSTLMLNIIFFQLNVNNLNDFFSDCFLHKNQSAPQKVKNEKNAVIHKNLQNG